MLKGSINHEWFKTWIKSYVLNGYATSNDLVYSVMVTLQKSSYSVMVKLQRSPYSVIVTLQKSPYSVIGNTTKVTV